MKRMPLRRSAALRTRKQLRRTSPLKRSPSMGASYTQRLAVRGRCCIVCGTEKRIDPAHLVPRSLGVLCPRRTVLSPAVSGMGSG
jgi:hypothetical protein